MRGNEKIGFAPKFCTKLQFLTKLLERGFVPQFCTKVDSLREFVTIVLYMSSLLS